MLPAAASPDRDFSAAVLADLYAYPRKRSTVAWILWLTLGWAGAHRFYLGREFSGLAMLLTGGGFMLWWAADAFRLNGMVRSFNADQAAREIDGRAPRGLDGMPSLAEIDSRKTPPWVAAWRETGSVRRGIRFVGDVCVLVLATTVLGSLLGSVPGTLEAVVAVALLAGLTAMGAGPDWLDALPVGRDIQHWSHRLRLFYRHNPPPTPPALVIRPIAGLLWAPFRARVRAEVRMYVELGAVFATGFLLLEVIPGIVVPALLPSRSIDLNGFVANWIGQVFNTFFVVYAFATPVGAILTRYLLLEDRHRVPRALAIVALVSVGLGMLVKWW